MLDPNAQPKDYSGIIYNKTEINAMNTTESSRVNSELDKKSDKQDEGSPSGIATLDPNGKVSRIELPISSNPETIDKLNNDTLISPAQLEYKLDAENYLTEPNADLRYGDLKSDGSVRMSSAFNPQDLNDIATVKFVSDSLSSNTKTYVKDTLSEMFLIAPILIGDICFVSNDGTNNGEYLCTTSSSTGSTISNWIKRTTDIAWGSIIGTLSHQTDLQDEFNLHETIIDSDAKLALKADKTYVDTELNLKADEIDLQNAVSDIATNTAAISTLGSSGFVILKDSVDIDTIVDIGSYAVNTNLPPRFQDAILVVDRLSDGITNKFTIQTLSTEQDGVIMRRTCTDYTSPVWTVFEEIQGKLDDLLDVTVGVSERYVPVTYTGSGFTAEKQELLTSYLSVDNNIRFNAIKDDASTEGMLLTVGAGGIIALKKDVTIAHSQVDELAIDVNLTNSAVEHFSITGDIEYLASDSSSGLSLMVSNTNNRADILRVDFKVNGSITSSKSYSIQGADTNQSLYIFEDFTTSRAIGDIFTVELHSDNADIKIEGITQKAVFKIKKESNADAYISARIMALETHSIKDDGSVEMKSTYAPNTPNSLVTKSYVDSPREHYQLVGQNPSMKMKVQAGGSSAQMQVVDDETHREVATMIWYKGTQSFSFALMNRDTGVVENSLDMFPDGTANLHNKKLMTIDDVDKYIREMRKTVDSPISGSNPTKAECSNAAQTLPHWNWSKDDAFYMRDNNSSKYFLIKYRANGDTDISGTNYKFYFEKLTAAS